MIVFVRTKQATEEIAEKLRARGFSAAAINGDIPQAQRERTIAALKDGGIDILVATDVAARGLDMERISHVLSTTTSRTTPSPTYTGSDALAGPAVREMRCCSSPRGSATCSRRSKRQRGSQRCEKRSGRRETARNCCSNPPHDRLESPSRREDVKGQRDSALNAQNHGEGAFDLAHRVGRQRSQSFQQAGAGDGTHAAADGDARGVHTFVR